MMHEFTSREIVEMLLITGYYTMLARSIQALEIYVDAPAGKHLIVTRAEADRKDGQCADGSRLRDPAETTDVCIEG
jgi:hypothetical protein